MSLDNISRLSRSGLDELVPTRYAQHFGDIFVLLISDGVLTISASNLASNSDPADLAGWLGDNFLPPEVVDWPLNVVVVRSGDQTILVDAGLGLEFPDFPRAGQTVQRMEAAGIDPESVTDVVLTHLHMDHVGGLLTDGLKARLRPDLKIHLAAAEAEFWEAPDFSRTSSRRPRPSSGRRPTSLAPPCRGRSLACFGGPPHNFWTPTAAHCIRSRRNTRSRRGYSPRARAVTPPGTAWYAWSPAVSG
jgi:hypothetical protein